MKSLEPDAFAIIRKGVLAFLFLKLDRRRAGPFARPDTRLGLSKAG